MVTSLLITLFGISLICSLILVAAMVVAARANNRSAETLELLERIQRPSTVAEPDTDARTLEPSATALHRNIAGELRTNSAAEHARHVATRAEEAATESEQPLDVQEVERSG